MKINPKVLNKIFKYIFISLFISFIALYMSQANGYYAYEQHKKVVFTEEKIKQFEQDVADGKNIDINDYLDNTNKDYQTKTSSLGLKLSEKIGDYARIGIEKTFGILGKLVE